MKARVKATGEIIEVRFSHHSMDCPSLHYYKTKDGSTYKEESLDFDDTSDYWTRLEHQAAIAAMQGMLSNQGYLKSLFSGDSREGIFKDVARCARDFAHALVEQLKKEESK